MFFYRSFFFLTKFLIYVMFRLLSILKLNYFCCLYFLIDGKEVQSFRRSTVYLKSIRRQSGYLLKLYSCQNKIPSICYYLSNPISMKKLNKWGNTIKNCGWRHFLSCCSVVLTIQSHLSCNGGDEGRWSSGGDEREGMASWASRVSWRVERQTHGNTVELYIYIYIERERDKERERQWFH